VRKTKQQVNPYYRTVTYKSQETLAYEKKIFQAMMTQCEVAAVTTLSCILSPYRAVSTLCLCYTNQSVNAV